MADWRDWFVRGLLIVLALGAAVMLLRDVVF